MNNEPWKPSAEPQPNNQPQDEEVNSSDNYRVYEAQPHAGGLSQDNGPDSTGSSSHAPGWPQPIHPAEAPTPLQAHGSMTHAQQQPLAGAGKRKPKLKLAVIVAAAVALLAGGGVAAYNFWYQNPDKVITDALVNGMNADTIKVAAKFTSEAEDSFGSFDANLVVDNVNMAASIDTSVKDIELDAGETADISLSAIYANEALYGRLNNVSDVFSMVLGMSGIDTDTSAFTSLASSIDGKWVQLYDAKSDSEVSEEYTCSMEVFDGIDTEAFSKEVRGVYSDNRFIVVAEKLGSKDVNGAASLGYRLEVDEDAFERFAEGLEDTTVGKQLAECSDSDTEELPDYSEPANEAEEVEAPSVNVWISRWSHQLTKVEVFDDEARLDADFTYDEEVSVTAPKESVSVEEFMEQLQAAVMTYYFQQMQSSDPAFDSSPIVGPSDPAGPSLFF